MPDAEPDPQQSYEEKLYAIYQAQRSEADKFALEIAGRYEKMLSLLAGGALAVSVTFIEKIAPKPVPWSKWIAGGAWLALVFALIATLIALFQSQNAIRKKVDNLDREIAAKIYPDNAEAHEWMCSDSNPFSRKVVLWSSASRWSTIGGLILLVVFSVLNFPSGNIPQKNETENPYNEDDQLQGDTGGNRHPKKLRAAVEHGPASSSQTETNSNYDIHRFELKWQQVVLLLNEHAKKTDSKSIHSDSAFHSEPSLRADQRDSRLIYTHQEPNPSAPTTTKEK